jgi:predicted ATPase
VRVSTAPGRLLTLTGTGGFGKTRLALEVGGSLIAAFAGGVWLVDLTALSDPALLPQAVADALSMAPPPADSLLAALVAYLRPRHLLLILNNCEHLIGACAALAGHLLAQCPRLSVLATSREPLRIPGEVAWRVPSLTLPSATFGGAGPQPALAAAALAELAEYPAVCLLVERARTGQPEFVLTPQNAPAVIHLCRRLDGIPLALKLAAARLRTLALDQIVARLDDRFHLLTGSNRLARPRHQTLAALLDWSYDLLPPPSRPSCADWPSSLAVGP